MDRHELMGAEWMSADKLRSLVAPSDAPHLDGLVSQSNWTLIETALAGKLIVGQTLPNARNPARPTMLYTAAPARL